MKLLEINDIHFIIRIANLLYSLNAKILEINVRYPVHLRRFQEKKNESCAFFHLIKLFLTCWPLYLFMQIIFVGAI